jgi:hypothetical protein
MALHRTRLTRSLYAFERRQDHYGSCLAKKQAKLIALGTNGIVPSVNFRQLKTASGVKPGAALPYTR